MSEGKKPKRPPLPSRLKKKSKSRSSSSASGFSISFSAHARDSDSSESDESLGITHGASASISPAKRSASAAASSAVQDAPKAVHEPAEQLRSSRVQASRSSENTLRSGQQPPPSRSAVNKTVSVPLAHGKLSDSPLRKTKPAVPANSPALRQTSPIKSQDVYSTPRPGHEAAEKVHPVMAPATPTKASGAAEPDDLPAQSQHESSAVTAEAVTILADSARPAATRTVTHHGHITPETDNASTAAAGSPSREGLSSSVAASSPIVETKVDARKHGMAASPVDVEHDSTVSEMLLVGDDASRVSDNGGDPSLTRAQDDGDCGVSEQAEDSGHAVSSPLWLDPVSSARGGGGGGEPTARALFADDGDGDDGEQLFRSSLPSTPLSERCQGTGGAGDNTPSSPATEAVSSSLPAKIESSALPADDASPSWHPLMALNTAATEPKSADTAEEAAATGKSMPSALQVATEAAPSADQASSSTESSSDTVSRCDGQSPTVPPQLSKDKTSRRAHLPSLPAADDGVGGNIGVRPRSVSPAAATASVGGFVLGGSRPVSALSFASSSASVPESDPSLTSLHSDRASSPSLASANGSFPAASPAASRVSSPTGAAPGVLLASGFRQPAERPRYNDLLWTIMPIPGPPLFRKHLFLSTIIFFLLSVELSPFLLGSMCGTFVMTMVGCFLLQYLVRVSGMNVGPTQADEEFHFHSTPATVDKDRRILELLPHMEPPDVLEDAWTMTYNYEGPATHHPNRTTKVYLRLEGAQLTISTVREDSMSWRKEESSDNDSESDAYGRPRRALFTHSRTINLRNSLVRLVPDNLNKRQRWSKKFPIRLTLSAADQKEDGTGAGGHSSGRHSAGHRGNNTPQRRGGAANPYQHTVYFLFAGRSRDKMDWFMRMEMAADPTRACAELSNLPREYADYLSYTAHLLPDLQLPELPDDHPTQQQQHANRDSLRKKISVGSEAAPRRPDGSPSVTRHFHRPNSTVGASATSGSLNVTTSTSAQASSSHTAGDMPVPSPRGSRPASPDRRGGVRFVSSSPNLPRRLQDGSVPRSIASPFGSLLWFNAGLGRLFYDAWREPRWAEKLKVRWQRKLSRIKLPPFIKTLVMKDLNLGHSLPVVKRVYQPQVDGRGLWLDVLLTYKGSFQVTIATGLDLVAQSEASSTITSTSTGTSDTSSASDNTVTRTAATTSSTTSEPQSPEPNIDHSARPDSPPPAAVRSSQSSMPSPSSQQTHSPVRKPLGDTPASSSAPTSVSAAGRASAALVAAAVSSSSRRHQSDVTSSLTPAVAASLARRRRRRLRRRMTQQDSDKSDIDSGDDADGSLITEIAKKFTPVLAHAHPLSTPPTQRRQPSLVAHPLSTASTTRTSSQPSPPPRPPGHSPGQTDATAQAAQEPSIAAADVPDNSASSEAVTDQPAQPTSEVGTDDAFAAVKPPSLASSLLDSVLQSTVVEHFKEKISSIPVGLLVKVEAFEGIITINIPPPPTGAVWFGFRYEPQLKLSAVPFIGTQSISISQVSKLIEDKIVEEVLKRLVLPNMEDLSLPLLSSGLDDDTTGPGCIPVANPADLANAMSSESKPTLLV
eukprot:scpid15214/ scgid5252/ Testis-expressed sequence 2 protein